MIRKGPFGRATLLALALLAGAGASLEARAVEAGQPLHYSGDKQVWDRKSNKVELFGNAVTRQPGETLTAEYIRIDLNARTLYARGNCVYTAPETIIYSEEMHFSLDTHTGTIVGGRISSTQFTLAGERINKLGEGRFQTHWGQYSTCKDCPQSWTIQAEDVDMELGGYAYMSNVTAKIKEAPAFWVPYLVVPLKSRRQTGVLFPNFGVSDTNGFVFVLPFFWAINDSADMTFGVGEFGARGRRLEWEGRYALTGRSGGRANLFFLNDRTAEDPNDPNFGVNPNRWALKADQVQELPLGIEYKLQLAETSDNLYPIYVGDIRNSAEIVTTTSMSLSYHSSDMSAYLLGTRIRNLFNVNPDPILRKTEFDPRTVQVLPHGVVTTNDQFILDTPLAAGLTLGVTNFTRTGGLFDPDYFSPPSDEFRPGIDPIREATRVSVTPSLYTTLRPFDVISVIPSLRYYSYFYSFHNALVPNLNRGYLLFQTELSAQLERVYGPTEGTDIVATKHLFRPILLYSNIPFVREDETHPFLSQIKRASGYNFDRNDIVPLGYTSGTRNYFAPLGNSLAYGFVTQVIRKRGGGAGVDPTYQRSIELQAGQSINFREYTDPEVPGRARPFTRFFSNLDLGFDRLSSSTSYFYYPHIEGIRHQISTTSSYVFERGMRQGILLYDRSASVGYSSNQVGCLSENCPITPTSTLKAGLNFSLNDYFLPSVGGEYDLLSSTYLSSYFNLQFQSPSQCWRLRIDVPYARDRGWDFRVDLSLNIDGRGFGGVGAVAAEVAGPR